jgi:hypothetical protein
MPLNFDATEFVDADLHAARPTANPYPTTHSSAVNAPLPNRAPTREEVDLRVSEAQQKLTELRRQQDDLERERSQLEETRRRQMEYQTGRQEMVQHLTRGSELLAEAEFAARRDAEQMAKTLADLRAALAKVQSLSNDGWNKENFDVELTRALTAIESARMEWNSARLKWPVLAGEHPAAAKAASETRPTSALAEMSLVQLCRLGLAFTWPLAAVALVALILFAIHLLRH